MLHLERTTISIAYTSEESLHERGVVRVVRELELDVFISRLLVLIILLNF